MLFELIDNQAPPPDLPAFRDQFAAQTALAHASRYNRGIGDEHTDTFVGMYVNQWTVDYGARGRQAVQRLLDRGHEAGIIPERVPVDFVDSTGD